jgi:drug/metabolite transporter (DMT)-like permease
METLPLIFALCAGCTAAFQGLLYKMGGEKGNRPDAFLSAFMATAMIVPAVLVFGTQPTWGRWELWTLGIVMGALVYLSIQCLIAGNKRGPASIGWAFMSLSLLVTVVQSAVFLRGYSLLGVDALTLLLFVAMVWVMQRGMAREARDTNRAVPWVFWLLMAGIILTNGSYLFGLKLKEDIFGDTNTFALAILYPGFGALMALIAHLIKRRKETAPSPLWTWREIWTGLLAGICAGTGNICMLSAMALPPVVSFPIMQGMGLVGGIFIMAIAYKERFNRAKMLSVLLAVIVLLVAIFRAQLQKLLLGGF